MKIIELIIDELEDFMGFDAVALVESPAHEANFYAFNEDEVEDAIALQIIKKEVFKNVAEQFVNKIPGESKDDYIARCIPVLINEGYDQDQATAICYADYDSFDETQDPQEIKIGDYQTRHYDMCPAATALYTKIENQEIDVDMGLAIRSAKLQDALYWLEKHTVQQMGHASFDDVKAAEVLTGEIMHLARMMGLEEEHQYVLGHLQTIRNLYQQGEQEMNIDVSTLPDYTTEVTGSLREFQSYDDYPQAASDNACKVLRWIDEHGRDEVSGMTQVGLTRANQLCKRQAISEETIARMAAFERHRRNAEISDEYRGTPWKDKGYVAWLGWGGDEGIAWAQRKLNRIRQEREMSKFSFSLQEDKQIVVGPLMIPNKLIFRVDENGEPYYVYFTEETIDKIARKMMKEEKLTDINLEHSQEDKVDGWMLETWLVEDPQKDKQQVYGMDYPAGTWMGMYKIEDTGVWQKVKNGQVKAFSIEGYFADRLVQN